jgi:hypothetical protein
MTRTPRPKSHPARRWASAAALAALLLLPAASTWAVDPCAEDVIRLCPGTSIGKGAVRSCLKKNEAALGETCRAKLAADDAAARAVIREFSQACRVDMEQFCPTVEPGAGRVLGCLSQHQIEISKPCLSELDRVSVARERLEAFRSSCGNDLKSICADVPQQAGPLLECLEANEARVSETCKATDLREISEASALVEVIEDMTSKERVREALEILQGLDSVAFSRSQVLLQFDSFQSLAEKGNGGRMLFNPQFVFGKTSEFALQVKVPVSALYPYAAGAPTQFGLGAVATAFAWNFMGGGRVRQYLAIGLQWETASSPAIGGPWAIVPSYAIGAALARWVSLTTQVQWIKSIGSTGTYPAVNLLIVEPILVGNLPGRSFVALDTRLAWSFTTGTFIPIMKGMVGLFTDRQKSLSVSAWYQATLTQPAASQFFKYGVGMGLAYFFDW